MFLFRDGSFTLMNMASPDVPGNDVVFPTHNSKVFKGDFMACGVVMVHDGRW